MKERLLQELHRRGSVKGPLKSQFSSTVEFYSPNGEIAALLCCILAAHIGQRLEKTPVGSNGSATTLKPPAE